MAAMIACDEPTDAVDNSGRIGNFILRSLAQLGQQFLIGRYTFGYGKSVWPIDQFLSLACSA